MLLALLCLEGWFFLVVFVWYFAVVATLRLGP